jgi:5S rRNA maturation endonuclease (ribonuclease M5)
MASCTDRFAPLSEGELATANPVVAPAEHEDGVLISPVPADAPDLPMAHHKLGKPTGRWAYCNASGAVLSWALRFDPPGRGKAFLPLTLWRCGECLKWRWEGVPAPRPLYGLDRLAARPNDRVIICEGEKSAEAAAKIFPDGVATTSPNGSGAAAKADWAPLKGRPVMIWPDADKPGDDYASDVTHILDELGCDISVIDAQALAAECPNGGKREPQEGWDAADAIIEWSDLALLRKSALAHARPFNPGPAFVSWGPFTMGSDGLFVEKATGKGETAKTAEFWISASFEILGASRDPRGHGWGKWIRWCDADERTHTRHVAESDLQGDPSTLCAALADAGLRINRSQQRAFVTYLSGVKVRDRVTHVDHTGWHEIDHQQVFVLPDHTIRSDHSIHVVLDSSVVSPYEARGTLREWQEGIGTLACGHALPLLMISAAFAGPLLHLVGQGGGGIHVYGQSSKGKTTILRTAASVWGRGDSPGYIRGWRTTANGLEGIAAGATDTALVLDELGIAEAREAAAMVYSLANGTGKGRARRDGSARVPLTWRLIFMSSGELPIQTKLAEDRGRKARAGQLVRMLDIPADRGFGFGAFDNGGPTNNAAKLADLFKQAAITAYGTAGPEFVRRVIAECPEEIGKTVREMIATFVSRNVPRDSDGQVTRAAQRLGLIAAAGELASTTVTT